MFIFSYPLKLLAELNLQHLQINDALIKELPTPVAVIDTQLNFIAYSKRWLVEHNITQSEIISVNFFDALSHIPYQFKDILNNCLKGNSNQNEGQEFKKCENQKIWLKWNINPWKNENGSIGGLVINLEDITAKKHLEDLVQKAQEVSRTGGWQVDLLTYKTQWTKMVNIIHEMPLDYVPQTYDECFVHFKEGTYRNKIIAASDEAIKYGTPWDEEVIMVTGTGKEIWIRTKGHAEFIDGKCVRIFGICQDIDKYKRQQLAYTESAEKLKMAVTASKVGTWEYYLDTGKTVWDDITFSLHGVPKDNYTGSLYRNWKNAIHPDDFIEIQKAVIKYYNGGGLGSGTVEYRVLLPNNQVRILKSTVTVITDPKSAEYKAVGITQDVTNEKLAEKKLKEFAEITGKQNNSLTNFAHMVSHDLRAHSTNLSVLTSLLKDEKDEDQKLQILEMLKSATESLNSTVYNLNEVVQSNSKDIRNELTKVNVLEVIHTVKNNIGTLFQEKNATCTINVATEHNVKVVPAYLDSIILNLFTNSLKYSSPTRDPKIVITTTIVDEFLELTFTDNGKGIDLEKYGATIFGMHKTFHRNKDARGVGLYITKNQVEAMGGSITVQSKVNSGTSFKILFLLN